MIQYVAFDLEIAKELPEGSSDWKAHRPLGITCAATYTSEGEESTWHSAGRYEDGTIAAQMTPSEVRALIEYLYLLENEGAYILTWNGLGFDFDVLAEESDSAICQRLCKALAVGPRHIDIGFAMHCQLGYMIGLDTAAKGLGLAGKIEGMNGAKAPAMWKQGAYAQKQVLEYVAQDARTTANVYEAIMLRGYLPWRSKSGRAHVWRPMWHDGRGMTNNPVVRERLLSVKESLLVPGPDTSWMTNPRSRESFYAWAK